MHVDKATCFVAWHSGNLEIRKLFLFFYIFTRSFIDFDYYKMVKFDQILCIP